MFNPLALPSLASIARDKLHGATSHTGSKDDARLYRWVLLKNSLTNALSRSGGDHYATPSTARTSSLPTSSPLKTSQESSVEVDAFMFPDGDVFADCLEGSNSHKVVVRQNTKDELESEARWLDSLLESLGDDDTESSVVSVGPEEEDEDSDLVSLFDLPSTEDLTSPTLLTPPESILLPPSPPFNPVDYESPPSLHVDRYFYPPPPYPSLQLHGSTPPPALPVTYSNISDLSDDIDAITLPDALEDSSSSDSDSESLNTPWTRSTSSLSSPATSLAETELLATPRPSFVRIVDADDDVPIAHNLPYRYSMQSGIPSDVVDPYQQEC